jgi:membrane protease YdiL (CAAX protease family)
LKSETYRPLAVGATIILAALLWFVTFSTGWATFWIKICVSASSLAVLSFLLQPHGRRPLKFDAESLWMGLLSAALLYVIFWGAKVISTAVFPFAGHQIGGIYGKGAGTPTWVIALLLFFVTGPAEELYWRGYLQHNLMIRFGRWQGWLLATAIYAAVHTWSFNFMLIGAAGVAGAFWGSMYWRLNNLAPVIISHSIWSMVIFAVFPLS